jgi:uncharacterized RDD family membrane protein YckC
VTQADDGTPDATAPGAPAPVRAPHWSGPAPHQQAPYQQPGPHQAGPWQQPGAWMPPPVALTPDGRQLADFGNRLLAYLLDSVIVGVVAAVLVAPLMSWFTTRQLTPAISDPGADPGAVFAELLVPLLLIELGVMLAILGIYGVYYVESIYRSGRTLGKKAVGLAVVPLAPGARMTRAMVIRRFLVQVGGGMIVPLFTYVDGLWQLWDKPYQQTLHDKAAGTVVIKVSP